MIRLDQSGSDPVLEGYIQTGATAYIDRDWLCDPPAVEVPAIVVNADRKVVSTGVAPVDLPDEMGADRAVALALAIVAQQAADAVRNVSGAVRVSGTGAVAGAVRRLLAARSGGAGEPAETPTAIVETTGDPERIVAATRDLSDLGSLVLAGPTGERKVPINLYPDVHRRGLRVVGIAPPLADWAPSVASYSEAALELGSPTVARIGHPIPPGTWYQLSG